MMPAMGSRLFLLFIVLITSSLYLNQGSLASPINEQLDNVAFRPRELDDVLNRINKAPLSRREDDDLLPTATDTKCKNTPPNGGQWESEKVDFPTVVSLKADMKTCGNIGPNTVFFSWGIGAGPATTFANTLSPKGMTFNDALDFSFIEKMAKFNLGAPSSPRFILFVQRWEEAMASLLYGTVYLVVPTGYGAYSVPGTARNDWYKVEFPTVQRNALAQVVKVVIGDKDGFPQSTGWLPNDSAYAELPAPNTDAIPVPPASGTSTQTCKLQPITGGKAGILGYVCNCNTGPTPSPVTTSGTVSCPTATAASK